MGLGSDQILSLDKHYLNPRRPPKSKLTNFDKEEGLFPYEPEIKINTMNIISYYKKVTLHLS